MPTKVDYWNTGYVRSELNDVLPPHAAGMKIKKTTFTYVWRNFHTERNEGKPFCCQYEQPQQGW
jgi:hypothetical protein